MLRRFMKAAAFVCIPFAGFVACDSRQIVMGHDDGRFAGLGPVDSGTDEGGDASARVAYCPTNKCPPGWTTCPSSRYPCDVNLKADIKNCGACGTTCPPKGRDTYSCVDGACVAQCNVETLDCDGVPDNGCETMIRSNDHCGACGNKCTDPAKPCTYQGEVHKSPLACGCPPGQAPCGLSCVDISSADGSCGACFKACDPSGGGAPTYPNTYYGCRNRRCGAVKCKAGFGDCDGVPSNGCETSFLSDDNCGGCGVACPAGQACRLNIAGSPECMCPAGRTYCEECKDGACRGRCVDLTNDVHHCGACGEACLLHVDADPVSSEIPFARSTCDYSTCVSRCIEGRADCNESLVDGCEVDISSDPKNCGACGHVCDAVPGQACVAGQCTIEPCVEDAGGGFAR